MQEDDKSSEEQGEVAGVTALKEVMRRTQVKDSEMVFGNDGKIHSNNREYRRNMTMAWRAIQEGQHSKHFYTKKKSSKRKQKNRRK